MEAEEEDSTVGEEDAAVDGSESSNSSGDNSLGLLCPSCAPILEIIERTDQSSLPVF